MNGKGNGSDAGKTALTEEKPAVVGRAPAWRIVTHVDSEVFGFALSDPSPSCRQALNCRTETNLLAQLNASVKLIIYRVMSYATIG